MNTTLHFLIFTAALAAVTALKPSEVPNGYDDKTNSEIIGNANIPKLDKESTDLIELSSKLIIYIRNHIFKTNLAQLPPEDQIRACKLCRDSIEILKNIFDSLNGTNHDTIAKEIIVDACMKLKRSTKEFCLGFFALNWPALDFIINNTIAEPRSICGVISTGVCQVEQREYNFTLKIDANGPKLEGSKKELPVSRDVELNILHLTDIHYDPNYNLNSLAVCPELLCCNKELANGTVVNPADLAGYWSDYRSCDTPKHMIINALDHIKATHKIDFIYHTGDVPPHNEESTTKEGNRQMLTEVDRLITEKFPNTPVYSCLGNHESHPADIFGNAGVPEELSVVWLYEHVWSLWSKWLPESAKQTVLKGGYYTVAPQPGHRIIALNSMDCYLWNYWIFYNGSFVLDQLNWLHDTLLAAEKAGEYVHILSHIPSRMGDCWSVWANEYNRLITRFNHIITGIFNGHTHSDEIIVHYTDENFAVAVSWNGGSLTTYTEKNPNYRIFNVDAKTLQVLDHHTWSFNLTEANLKGAEVKPHWYEEYQFTKEFTSDTSPDGLDRLLIKMAEHPELLRKYWRYRYVSSDIKLKKGCDNECLMKTICDYSKSAINKTRRCKELQQILAQSLKRESDRVKA